LWWLGIGILRKQFVMAGQKRVFARDVPAIHVLLVAEFRKTWMPGIKAGHDVELSRYSF